MGQNINLDERLVKSYDRVRELAEVFTPHKTVQEMLDLFPQEIWEIHPSPTFLEPSCGDGNFLVAILDRKLSVVGEAFLKGTMPAGRSVQALEFHCLEAMSSLYGVDISPENIFGDGDEHPVGARERLVNHFSIWLLNLLEDQQELSTHVLELAQFIVDNNVILGNMLPVDETGKATNRDALPVLEYKWHVSDLSVSILKTSFGDVFLTANEDGASDMLQLFAPEEPEELWSGIYSGFTFAQMKA